jgi:Ca2+-binding EF-hand superfamily protein
VEKQQKLLKDKHDFSVQLLFSIVDFKKKNYITSSILKSFLQKKMELDCENQEIFLLMRRFNSLDNGKLTFEEFNEIFDYPENPTKSNKILLLN